MVQNSRAARAVGLRADAVERSAAKQIKARYAERTVSDMVSDGRIVAYRLGGTIRFDLNEIDASFVASGGRDGV